MKNNKRLFILLSMILVLFSLILIEPAKTSGTAAKNGVKTETMYDENACFCEMYPTECHCEEEDSIR
jgi:hypothetical protein